MPYIRAQVARALASTAVVLLMGLAAGCDNGSTDPGPPPFVVEFDFTNETHGWTTGFSDFPVGDEENMEIEEGHRTLPPAVASGGKGLFVGATNRSDDVFMFSTGRAGGLEPGARYRVEFEVDFATEVPFGCVGIGGSPGESVHVKVGATPERPERVVDGDAWYRMNIDKGNQITSGEDAIRIGDVANSNECPEQVWEIKTLASEDRFEVVADDAGFVWLLVGTDSGFEGRTELFYTRYRAEFRPL